MPTDTTTGDEDGRTRKRKTNEKENAVPQFFKHRPVPFALKEKIDVDLCRLEKIGVLEKVEFPDWATPIVPVLKPDGSVFICQDCKITINPALDVHCYFQRVNFTPVLE